MRGEALNIALMQAVAGRLLLTVRQALPAGAAAVELAARSGPAARAAVRRVVPVAAGAIVAAELQPLCELPLFDERFAVTLLDAAARPLARGEASLTPVGIDADGVAPGHRVLVERAIEAGAFPPAVAAALRWRFERFDPAGSVRAHLDHGVPLGGGAVVEGWIANLGARRPLLLSDGLESVRTAEEVATFDRPDISALLVAEGRTATTDRHAFVSTLPLFRPGDRGFLLFEERGDDVAFLARLSWNGAGEGSADQALQTLARRHGNGEFLPPERARTHLGPLLGRATTAAPGYDVVEVAPAQGPPALSVVVPLFGSPVLLRGLLQNQGAFPAGTEFVLVSDDPDLHDFARDHAMDRRPLLAHPTRLLLNRANYGFSVANALGVREARAPVLLLMNSDIRVEDATGLHDALAAVAADRFGVVGLRLLFEDGTVQHDGMTFERNRRLHDLYTSEHRAKGLPPLDPPPDEPVAAVPAVTGAMMLLRRALFERLGGFDPVYVRGDFEDGDLCLRAAEAGQRVGIARRGRVRHLERQSIAGSAGSAVRRSITHLNCLRFNERWAARLDAAA